MNTIIFNGLFSLLTAFAAPEAVADGAGADRGHRGRGQGMCEVLECSDEQRTQIKAIRAEQREATSDERARVKEVRAALHAERGSPKPDAAKVASLQAELDTLKTAMKKAKQESRTEVAAVLTPEQRERFDAMKAKRAGQKGKKGKAHARSKDERGKASARAGKQGKRSKAHARVGKPGKRGKPGKASARAGKQGKAQRFAAKAERRSPRPSKAQARSKGKGNGKALARGRSNAKRG